MIRSGGMYLTINRGGYSGGNEANFIRQQFEFLRAENDKYDEEVRTRHAADIDTTTGDSEMISTRWADRTRGEKLRELKKYIELYEAGIAIVKAKRQEIQAIIDADEQAAKTDERACVGHLDSFEPLLNDMIREARVLEKLVLDEVEPGWQWRTGIEEQKTVRAALAQTNGNAITRLESVKSSLQELHHNTDLFDHILG